MNRQWIALIPAYKPELLMLSLLQEIRQAGFEAVVVDDGGGAAFATIFQKAASLAVVLTHPENQGKGRALKTGLAYIWEHWGENSVIVTLDADGQHQVSDAKKICQAAQEYPNTLVLGSRGLGQDVPLRSQFGNTITRFIYRLSTGVAVHDTQTGLRAFSGCLVPQMLEITGERYEYEMNVLLECASRGIFIQEIEIATIYIDNNSGSHFDTFWDSYRVYKEILKFSASSLIGFGVDYAVYSLMLLLTASWKPIVGLWISNITARILSASANYFINRELVFGSKSRFISSALKYVMLVVVIMVGNTLLLTLLVEQMRMGRYIAKICTEVLFFALSWVLQRFIVFRDKTGGSQKA